MAKTLIRGKKLCVLSNGKHFRMIMGHWEIFTDWFLWLSGIIRLFFVSCLKFLGFSLSCNLILSLDLKFSSNFTTSVKFWIFLFIHFYFSVFKEIKAKFKKWCYTKPCFGQITVHLAYLRLYNAKIFCK